MSDRCGTAGVGKWPEQWIATLNFPVSKIFFLTSEPCLLCVDSSSFLVRTCFGLSLWPSFYCVIFPILSVEPCPESPGNHLIGIQPKGLILGLSKLAMKNWHPAS
jgi:hypothetical protein